MISLAEAKIHLRVVGDQDNDDIQQKITAADALIRDYLGFTAEQTAPAPVQAACLLLVGDLYENRERQQLIQLHNNPTYSLLLAPYRSYAPA